MLRAGVVTYRQEQEPDTRSFAERFLDLFARVYLAFAFMLCAALALAAIALPIGAAVLVISKLVSVCSP